MAQEAKAVDVQDWRFPVERGWWVGAQYQVTHPDNIHVNKAQNSEHKAFISASNGQQIIILSLPVWVWADHTRLAGLWCLLATTYSADSAVYIHMTQNVNAGLIPMSILTRASDQ